MRRSFFIGLRVCYNAGEMAEIPTWAKMAGGLIVVGLGVGACNYIVNRGDNDPVITVEDGDAAASGVPGLSDGEVPPVYSSTAASPAISTRPSGVCGIIDGNPNVFRVVLNLGVEDYSPNIVVTVYDRSGPDQDGDGADGSIKHGPKPLGDYLNTDYVHNGDEVCVGSSVSGVISETTAISATATSTPTIEPTSVYAPPDPAQPLFCGDLGLPLDNTIESACQVAAQNGSTRTTLMCNGDNGLSGFVQIDVYDYDSSSANNPSAVSVRAQVGGVNQAVQRQPFGSTCVGWRGDFPAFVNANPDLFSGPVPTLLPTGTPEASSLIDKREISRADYASLVAASVQKGGTIYADVLVATNQNALRAKNVPRNPTRRKWS